MSEDFDIITVRGERLYVGDGGRDMYYSSKGVCLDGVVHTGSGGPYVAAELGTEIYNYMERSGITLSCGQSLGFDKVEAELYRDKMYSQVLVSLPNSDPVLGEITPGWSWAITMMLKAAIPHLMFGPLENPLLLDKVCDAITVREGNSGWARSINESTLGMEFPELW